MSMARCSRCGLFVDTDDDPASMIERKGPFLDWMEDDFFCLCERCREELEEEEDEVEP